VTRIVGRGRVEAVEVEDCHVGDSRSRRSSGVRRLIPCDTVVFTGDWIPDHELARAAGLDIDSGSLSPLVDTALRTSRPGVFAAGNLLHPVDTADVAALDGRHVAAQVQAWLRGERPTPGAIRIRTAPPLRWVAPGLIRRDDPAPSRARLLLWTDQLVRAPHVVITQDGRRIAGRRLGWPASPGRVFRLPADLLDGVDFDGGDVRIELS
jgi:hypothetical protein